jgi:hypothetical protein
MCCWAGWACGGAGQKVKPSSVPVVTAVKIKAAGVTLTQLFQILTGNLSHYIGGWLLTSVRSAPFLYRRHYLFTRQTQIYPDNIQRRIFLRLGLDNEYLTIFTFDPHFAFFPRLIQYCCQFLSSS